ncbi:MAG: RagB/SusD family nutrient uptake outer membrane protein [Bacteroidales bacterium]|nr:RagB/SusD family nutrient uptake outer membrane protein [Bacteroidales bacterium]
MKKFNLIFILIWVICASCNDFLDREPLSDVKAANYLTTETALASYANDQYQMLPTHGQYGYGTFESDNNTDNMAGPYPSNKFAPGYWKVDQTGGTWWFGAIRRCNYFFDNVLPRLEKKEISGDSVNIKHYIGEMYFFRAYAYFDRLVALGDFPIIKHVIPDNQDSLIAVSKRSPCNEVARFILSDLDNAINLLQETSPDGKKNRISTNCARLFKSRVALFEGSWLKNFEGTAFVPNGPGWPGASKDYNANYQYPLGDIKSEYNFFFDQAMKAAKLVAITVPALVQQNSSGTFQELASQEANPYFDMFGDVDMSKYPEVLLWRQYDLSQGVTNSVGMHVTRGNNAIGTTRSMVNAFLLKNGEPIYYSAPYVDNNNSYWGDNTLPNITKNRDPRADIFIQKPGQKNFHTTYSGTHGWASTWIDITNSDTQSKFTTGYAIRKGLNFDGKQADFEQSTIGSIVFRAVEAYLNYIEARYERYGTLDGNAKNYWKLIRQRAKVNDDFQATINKTDMSKETLDWGAYTAGNLVDATRYNIRRERRCELMAEGLRWLDLIRWRSMDQMIATPYHIEGINLWETMSNWGYFTTNGQTDGPTKLIEGQNVSPRSRSKYLRPYEIFPNNIVYDGYRWNMAHYLAPIATQHFLLTSKDGDLDSSPIYQNPGWSKQSGTSPE